MKAETVHDPGNDVNTDPCPNCNEAGDPTWCTADAAAVIAAIASLPGHCTELLPGPLNAGPDDIGVHTLGVHTLGVHTPSPSPGWDTADEVIRWAVHIEDHLRAHLGHADRTGEPWRSLGDAVSYLTTWHAALLSCADAATIGLHALELARRLEQITGGADTIIVRLPDPCFHCGCRGLEHVDGADHVRCRQCLGTWPWSHYDAMHTYTTAAQAQTP